MTEFYNKLLAVSSSGHVQIDEEMKKHTTFRVGGPASYYVSPGNEEELAAVIKLCRQEGVEYFILGNGSNLLVSDSGFDGVVISMSEGFSSCQADPDQQLVTAGSGCLLSKIASEALKASLTGFEFASGIPGTLGGAVVMNAGAYGGEMKHVMEYVRVLTSEGEPLMLTAGELEMGYRTSIVRKNNYIVVEAGIRLKPGSQETIKSCMADLADRRRTKQPLEYPSGGSTFKRPEGHFAGKLIEEAGLRGYQVGGAQVSEKHCGFVINKGHATAAEIMQLCQDIRQRVKSNSGVELEMEVKTLGRF